MELRPLPDEVIKLLERVGAPPRLSAHLRLVHDVAAQLVEALRTTFPQLAFDAEAVRFGAATHDLGKALHPSELTGAGSEHEEAGHKLLLENGVDERRARFARTHAKWNGASIEDQLVSLADKIWKGRRQADLEQLVVARIAAVTGDEAWNIFMSLDELLAGLAASADERLEYQSRHSAER